MELDLNHNKEEVEVIAKELGISIDNILSVDVEQEMDDAGYYYEIFVRTTFSGESNYTRIIANDYDSKSIDVVDVDGFDLSNAKQEVAS